ncbi:MAG: hypothetical protein ABTQ32_38380 [Myxococcaceae bacterium]
MLALLVSACLAQEFGAPRLIDPFSRSVGVPVAAGRAAVEAFDGGFLVAWADDRRLTNLARTPIAGGEDVWVRVLRPRLLGSATQRTRLVCPGAGVTAGPRLAVSSTGLTGLAWSDERGVSLATLDQNGAWGAGPCGVLVSNLSTDLVEVSPRGVGFGVVHNGVSSLLQTNVFGGSVSVPTTRLSTRPSTVVTVSGASNTTVIGALTNQDLQVLREPLSLAQVPNVAAFDFVEGTPGPVIALIRDGGLFIGTTPAMVEFKDFASSRRPPYAVAIDGGVLVLSTALVGSGLQLYSTASTMTARSPVGLPEGLAMTADEGVALFSAPEGVLGATSVQPAPGFQGASVFVSMAGAIQRRPTLAWSAVDVGWELVWEEATTATTFAARHTLIRLQGDGGASSELFIDGGWPRVFAQSDGGLGYMALEGQVTTFSLSTGAGIVPVDQLDASVEGVVASAIGGFAWTGLSTSSRTHQEFTLRTAELPLEAFLPDEVTCATWFAGSYYVTRRGTGGATLAAFPDDTTPVAGVAIPQGQLACVAARLTGSPALALAVADGLGLKVSTLDAGWRVPFDAGVRDLQLTSVGSRWLVVWDTEDALHAALFSPAEGARELQPIDTRSQAFRGVPSLATSPLGAAAVAWPVLEGDSVELRVRVLSLGSVAPVFDGGVVDAGVGLVDAGVVDGGVASVDAGVVDGGTAQPDGGSGVDGGVPGAVTFVPVCGCTSVGDALWLVALVLVRKRRRPMMQ